MWMVGLLGPYSRPVNTGIVCTGLYSPSRIWFGLRVDGHLALSLHSSEQPAEPSQWPRHGYTVNIVIGIIIRPHRSTTYVDAAYCYRPSSVVCLSVCLSQQ